MQRAFGETLRRVTQDRPNARLVFHCSGPMYRRSCNVALRAIRLGNREVLRYRGGLEVSKAAGSPTEPAGRVGSTSPGV